MAQVASAHPQNLEEVRPSMAKADLKNLETAWRRHVGAAIARCFQLAGLTQDQGARELGKDAGQVGRWIAGAERPHVDALLASERLRPWFMVAFCECCGLGVEVETVVRLTRRIG